MLPQCKGKHDTFFECMVFSAKSGIARRFQQTQGACFSQHGNGSHFGMIKFQTFLSFPVLQKMIGQCTVRPEPTSDAVLQEN